MSDTTATDQGQIPDATDDTPPTDPRQTELSVADAARVLGLTSDAIRAKIRRGTMSGFKAPDDTWRVIVTLPTDTTGADPRQMADATPTDQGQTGEDPSTAASVSLIEHMQQEIEYLRMELAKRSRELATERERSDVLQREALGRIEALTSGMIVSEPDQEPGKGDSEATGSPQSHEPESTGIAAWWRRLWSG